MDTKKLRQKILDLAIRGKLVPQDPNDEPASVLLERIRTEKERLIKEGKIKRSKKSASDDEIEAPFEIPESWEWVRLEDFVMAITDGDHQPPPQSKTGVPFLVISDVNTGVINFSHARFVSEEYYNNLPVIRRATKGDILFTVTGSYGITILVDTEQNFCFQRHIGLVKTICCSEWITAVLQSDWVQKYCDKIATGTAQKTVSLGHLRDLVIPVPPLSEQKRIVNEIEHWFTLIDELESNEGDLLRAIDKAKSKILDLAIHGKLVPQDPNDEPAIELLKRINPKFEPCDNVNDLPKKWIQATLGDIGKWKSGGTPDRKIKSYYNNGQIPWLKIADIQDGYVKTAEEFITQEGLDNSSANINPVGSIALAMYGSIGKVGILTFPAATNQAICVCSDYVIEQKYLFYFLLSQRSGFYMMAGGGVQANISKQIIVKYPISIPPYNEQLRIVAKIKELFAVLNSIKKSLE